jgi:hypothetical protein
VHVGGVGVLGVYNRNVMGLETMSKKQIGRVRRMCLALPETTEKLSHGEPTFFVHKKVFVMFANNHHDDGHIAVWLPVPPGIQTALIESAPETFFNPPYVGVRGWVGIELDRITNQELKFHIQVAWELIAPKRLATQVAKTPATTSKPTHYDITTKPRQQKTEGELT